MTSRSRPAAPERTFRLGTLTVAGEQSRYALACDRCAVDDCGTVLLASVVGDARAVKGLGAWLNGNGKAQLRPAGLEFWRGEARRPGGYYNPALFRSEHRYRRHAHRLDYGRVHALFVSRSPDFLISADDESLWRALSGPRYTTPILPEWLPYLREQLEKRGLLTPAWGHRCACALLRAETAHLDGIVEQGHRDGALLFSYLDDAPAARTA
jgi:hypothetical protein